MIPVSAYAVEGCKVVEFEDRTEVFCEGDGKTVPTTEKSAVSVDQAQDQVAPLYQDAAVDAPAAPAKPFETGSASAQDAPPKTQPAVVAVNPRSTRPSFADRNTAGMERRRLILDSRPAQN
jgi:hypothetical protein